MKSKKIKIVVIALALVVIVIAVFFKFYIFRKADTSVTSRTADVVIEAGDLVKSFDQDEKTANVKYLNKIVMVNGVVDEIKDAQTNMTVHITGTDASSGVICNFDKNEFGKNPAIVGKHVSIKGICNGYLMDVILNKCAWEK